jgi:hypothetical protein
LLANHRRRNDLKFPGGERALLIAMAIPLAGCAVQRLNASTYTRTDGKPVDPAQQQAVFAQCKGEDWLHSGEAVSA